MKRKPRNLAIGEFILSAAFLILFFKAPFAFAEVVDKIIVVVNDEIITQSEVDKIIAPVQRHFRNIYSETELAERVEQARRNVLSKLIQDKLFLTEAKRRKIEVKEEEVDAKVGQIRKQFSSMEEFKKALAQENILLSELKKRHRERLMIDKLIEAETKGKISVAPGEVDEFYEKRKDEFREPRKVRLRTILIKITDERPEDAARSVAEMVSKRLREGGDFALLAKEYSDGPYAESGGEMGWIKEGELMDRLNGVVFALDENEISGIEKTNLGFHIFKVEEKLPPKMMAFADVKDEIEQVIYNKKLEAKLGRWLEQLKNNAYIEFR